MSPVITGAGGSGGGATPGAAITHRIPFAFNTAGLAAGKALYTPTIGDFMLDLWVEIDTVWDGTTPQLDVGTFDNLTTGVFNYWTGKPLPLDAQADTGPTYFSCVAQAGVLSSLRDLVSITMPTAFNDGIYTVAVTNVNLITNPPAAGNRFLPVKFTSATPVKVAVSQDGTAGGTAPGAAQGAGALCLVTSTPKAT